MYAFVLFHLVFKCSWREVKNDCNITLLFEFRVLCKEVKQLLFCCSESRHSWKTIQEL